MIEVGRMCKKIAGRDAGLTCVVVDIHKDGFVMIDGETRRRKCNPRHLVALPEKLSIEKGASHEAIVKALKEVGVTGRERKKDSKETTKSVVAGKPNSARSNAMKAAGAKSPAEKPVAKPAGTPKPKKAKV
jgi:large subunit ribosomal protein L14e